MIPGQMLPAVAVVVVVLSTPSAQAQFYGSGCVGCGPVTAPVAACTPIQPVQTTCYQDVPVTTYHREQRTVEEPYLRTTYEDREVTVMKPVTTQREVEIPTVSYRNVTENRTVTRDMGRWITRYIPVQKYSPCQVDARPGLIGWLNRTGYAFRTAFRPNYYTSRQYMPNMMACTIPVTRQVAVQGVRRVTVNETKMVADKTTRPVAVTRLEYRKRDVTVMRPQTAYHRVPIGSRLAYGYRGYGIGTATALLPTVNSRTARRPKPTPDPGFSDRTADSGHNPEPFPDDGVDVPDTDRFHRAHRTRELESSDPPTLFPEESSIDRGNLPVRGTYVRPAVGHSVGWTRTSPKTAMRSSSHSVTNASQMTLTLNSEN